MALGVLIAFANVRRHWEMRRIRSTGHEQNISGTPIAGSLFFLIGWRIAPLEFSPWIFLILLTEIAAFVTFSSEDGAQAEPE